MQCPIDGSTLQMTERSGIEIDYCPQCRGVWLDRGELDKMIERSTGTGPAFTQPSRPAYQEPRHENYQQSNDYRSDNYKHDKKRHKKENFLGDLFDF